MIICVCVQVFGSRVRVDAVSKVAELELAEKEKMKMKVEKIVKHDINVFINRYCTHRYEVSRPFLCRRPLGFSGNFYTSSVYTSYSLSMSENRHTNNAIKWKNIIDFHLSDT